ncbi:FAD dependent oxidoreductase superfamily [Aspergillus sclerotioniger CBS 115572]|uniref:FAD dependent oxidoreductase superfamily n=1 Tax=Aspergillus sclerotioniger CBS 115572 TaxID=1450535 RepID=A0A317UTQ8_9EURO|nr:FAD dependent oxidoreductase superfamily [Aspergillus sclerotioniger CBS 115572]PWY64965.1 FAD dependent oxidoreductase superfamily [Aspergillus sclerotioniger CBS 115572]
MPPSNCFPVPNPGECFWQTEPHELNDFRSTEQLPEHADIVIIGAGYAGASTAYHLLRDHGERIKSITILEARGACSGATGRNGGHLRPDFYGHIPTYVDRAGVRAGAEIAEFEISHLHAMKKVIEEENIDCDFTLARSIDVWCNEEAAQKAKAVYERMKSLDLEYMNDVAFYTGKNVEGICGVKGALACASFTAGTMWPYKFILHILKSSLATGKLNLQTFTTATAIKPSTEGGYSIETPAAQFTPAPSSTPTMPTSPKNIIPCKGICCRITVPEGTTAPLLNNSYINRTEDNTLSYLIPRPDGSIIVGGASSKFRPFQDQWYNNVDDSILIDSAKDYYDGYMQRTYRGWENSGAHVDKIWTGVMGYSYDSNPHIGAVPGKNDQFILAGFNGHGMPVIWRSAQELARMVVEKTTQFRIDRAMNGKESDGDILGTGNFPSTKP